MNTTQPQSPGSLHPVVRCDDRHTKCADGITVRCVREWLAALPEEWQDAPFEAVWGGMPVTLKRIVAYRAKDGGSKGVAANSMGTHLPFDDSLEWVQVLS